MACSLSSYKWELFWGFFSFPDLHGITVVRINIFGLVGKQNSETDVCLNVMFVAEAVLTF